MALIRTVSNEFTAERMGRAALIQSKMDQVAQQAMITLLIKNGTLTAWEVGDALERGYRRAAKEFEAEHSAVMVPGTKSSSIINGG